MKASCTLLLAATLAAAPAAAQTVAPFGFTAASAARQHALESRALELIRPALLDSIAALFADVTEPHIAGSDAQARTRDVALALTRAWGLRSEAPEFRVYLPWADSVAVTLLRNGAETPIALGEPVLSSDRATASQYPWVSGYSGAGTAEGEPVYVNYGLHDDYAALQAMGVSVRGRIVIARFGRSFRGIKARLAEEHGAIGLLIYSDPYDDGYFRGDPYPRGAYRAPAAAQRGSVMNGTGDPTTPLIASVAGVTRISTDSTGLPRIPVVALSWQAAEPILQSIEGAALPSQDWQGALPFRYHVGPGDTRVRVHVRDDRENRPIKPIWNTIAWLPGTDRADEWVVIGAHRDAWGAGALDNVSGTASVLAAAHAASALAAAGERPRRTIVFATWDAEEWGIIGSTEWVEQMAEQLNARVVAYLNQDAIAGGPSFGAAASPSLERLLHEVAGVVPSPADATRSVYDDWSEATGPAAALNDAPEIGNLGGGSDHAPFYNHLGIPSAGWGFGGGGNQYHSAYDTRTWMRLFGDPGYARHAASSRVVALTALRLANADILPFNYSAYATELRDLLRNAGAEAEHAGMDVAALEPLERALREMERDAADFAMARERWLESRRPSSQADDANRHLMLVERAMTREEGLRGRPWYRNLAFAADIDNGYATLAFPSIVEAIRSGDSALYWGEARDLSVRVARAASHLRAAREALRIEGR